MQFTFVLDVCFNFNTAFLEREEHRWNVNRKLITTRYLQVATVASSK